MADSAADSLAAMSLGNQCKACAKPTPLPVLICFECSEGKSREGESTYTKYCSVQCRTAHQGEHAQHCKDQNVRKMIYRIGELLQDAFYQIRETAFDTKIDSVKRVPCGFVFIRDGDYGDFRSEWPLYPFPNEKVKNEQDKKAILSFHACTEAVAYFVDLVQRLLKGITITIHSALLQIDAHKHTKVVRKMPSGLPQHPNLLHEIIAIDAVDGESYIIDPSGAQFGQFKAVIPLEMYLPEYTTKVVRVLEIDSRTMSYYKMVQQSFWSPNDDPRGSVIQWQVVKAFHAAVKDWEYGEHCSLGRLLSGNSTRYETCKIKLSQQTEGAMKHALEQCEEEGVKAACKRFDADCQQVLGAAEEDCYDDGEVWDSDARILRWWEEQSE